MNKISMLLVYIMTMSMYGYTYELTLNPQEHILELHNIDQDCIGIHCATIMLKKKSTSLIRLEKVICEYDKRITVCDGSLYKKQRNKCLFTEEEWLADGVPADGTIAFNICPHQTVGALNEYCLVLTIKKEGRELFKASTLTLRFFLSDEGDLQLLETGTKHKE